MIKFENKYFRKFGFTKNQIKRYLSSADKDLKIARSASLAEVKFQFAYNSFIKLGISLIACYGYRVKSRSGHHVKILEKAAEILKDRNILIYGNQMRKTRNTELYEGGSVMITDKQTGEYFKFVEKVLYSSRKIFKEYLDTLF